MDPDLKDKGIWLDGIKNERNNTYGGIVEKYLRSD